MRNFQKIYIEITNVCHLSCNFCPETVRKPKFMEVNLFKKALTQIKDFSQTVYFHVKGEPLLHPQIDTLLELCHEQGIRANITTSGVLIKKVKPKLFSKPALRQMNFSLHSFQANPMNITLDEYLNEIFSFITEMRANPKFIACFRLWNLNPNNLEPYSEKSEKKSSNHSILEKIENYFNLPYKIEKLPVRGNGIKVMDHIYINGDYSFEWPKINMPDLDTEGFCLGLRTQAGILVDGTVIPCCLDGEGVIHLGNINQSSFKEIIEGKRAADLYNGFSQRKIIEPLCKKCSFRKRFDKNNPVTKKNVVTHS